MGEQSPGGAVGQAPEDVVVFASWGPLSSWTLALIQAAATRAPSGAQCQWVVPADDLADLGCGHARQPRIVFTQAPGVKINAALGQPNLRCVVVIENPAEATAYCKKVTGVSAKEALRAVSLSMVESLAMRSHPKRLAMYHHGSFRARQQAEALLIHCGLHLDRAAVAGVLDDFCGQVCEDLSLTAAVNRQQGIGQGEDNVSANTADDIPLDAISNALNSFARMAAGMAVEPVIWSRCLFHAGAALDKPLAAQIDLTGPPRQVVGGPLLHIPPGRYNVKVFIGVDWRDPLPMRLEFCWLGAEAGPPPIQCAIDKVKPGRYCIETDVELLRMQDILDLRITLLESAIEGQLEFDRAELVALG